MKRKSAFTLVEIVMVTVVLGLLTGIIFRIYIAISQLSLEVKQEKEVFSQAVFATQYIQNLADRSMIDYTLYDDLVVSSGFVDRLLLQGDDISSLYLTGQDCGRTEFPATGTVLCRLQMQQGEKIIDITDPDFMYIKNLTFKIIPYDSIESYYQNADLCPGPIQSCLYTPGFWMVWEINTPRLPLKNPLLLQQFFTLQQ